MFTEQKLQAFKTKVAKTLFVAKTFFMNTIFKTRTRNLLIMMTVKVGETTLLASATRTCLHQKLHCDAVACFRDSSAIVASSAFERNVSRWPTSHADLPFENRGRVGVPTCRGRIAHLALLVCGQDGWRRTILPVLSITAQNRRKKARFRHHAVAVAFRRSN
jgi:hypothetical protein